MKHVKNLTTQTLAAIGDNETLAFLSDFASSDDSDKPITAGLFRLEKGKPLTYTYNYHEVKFIVSGRFDLEDQDGNKITASAGDLVYFPKGSTIIFSTPDVGVGFFCGQRKEGEL